MLQPGDEEVRGALTRMIARLGHAPALEVLAAELARPASEVGAALERLHDAHALWLHPSSQKPWVVHPFALAPGSCWVETAERGYWANCLYCALGIAAALRTDAAITTRIGGEGETVVYRVRDGAMVASGDLFHLSTPAARWWDNVVFACSSFQPFHAERDIDAWCLRHDLPRGAVFTLPKLWLFAKDWYGSYLDEPWLKRSAAEVAALFARHDLTGSFWALGERPRISHTATK